ncbi:hypothetical protein RDWZM_006252 [Blomia tropicalis]|uniref:C-1-tetrahydrofolate synthase, cytoplasmic n=1 Tax=Blomia tropicalis TaxID=40697 RepID=A0A9Q0M754_BLOTA|nr:hypothetical protein RDWZM_006252 [Blomia tropicalis]
MSQSKLINGKELADQIRAKLIGIVTKLSITPQLAIVQIGQRSDSNVYIKLKKQFADSVGVQVKHVLLDRTVTQKEVEHEIDQLNEDDAIHGIITQLPFESDHPIDQERIINRIHSNKDVDGLTAINSGNLLHGNLSKIYLPCTPYGCLELIKQTGRPIAGSNAVVIGRSEIIGSPMAQLLLWHDATVTICHSKTKNLAEICRNADILVVAIGQPLYIKKDWIKPGAVVIDCGINSISDPTKKSGQRLVGDIQFDEAKEVAGYITPVPGGVGPMTVAMLINNTVESARRIIRNYSILIQLKANVTRQINKIKHFQKILQDYRIRKCKISMMTYKTISNRIKNIMNHKL